MIKVEHAIIMAAGRGSRMMPLTEEIPKAMAKLGDKTLIINGIDKVKPFIDNLHITVGYKKADLAMHVIEHGVNSIINTEGKGNAWWVYHSLLSHLDSPIFVLTCDNVVDIDFDKLSQDYFDLGSPACMVVPVDPVEGLEGDYIFHYDQVVHELNRSKPSEVYCSGIQIINPYKVNSLTKETEDFYKLWEQLIAKKQLYCSRVKPQKWFTVDTMDQLALINKQV